MVAAVAKGVGTVSALIVEDDDRFARALTRVLSQHDIVVSRVESAGDAIPALDGDPDVVLLDWSLADGTAAPVLAALAGRRERTAAAVITGLVSGELWMDLSPQCDVILPKPLDILRIPDLVCRLAASRHAFVTVVRSFAQDVGLSQREEEILALACAGMCDKDILARCGCAAGTVATYWQRIFGKTGQRSQRDVIAAVLRRTAAHLAPGPPPARKVCAPGRMA